MVYLGVYSNVGQSRLSGGGFVFSLLVFGLFNGIQRLDLVFGRENFFF